MALTDVKVPDIGDFENVSVIEVLVKEGETVAADQSLITVESDKASMEIPSSQAGVVKSIKVKLGDKVSMGSVIMQVEAGESADAGQPAADSKAADKAADSAGAAPPAPAPEAAAPAPAGQAGGGTDVEVRVPDIGDFKNVAVIEVMVKPGDEISQDQGLITVESDKASMEIPSSAAGVLESLKVKVGDKINQGDLIAIVKSSASAAAPKQEKAAASPAPAPAPAPSAAPAPAAEAHKPMEKAGASLPHASPSVRKFARELGVSLEQVSGSGPKGRITQEDVQGFVKSTFSAMAGGTGTVGAAAGGGNSLNLLAWPKVDFSRFGEVERKPLSRIKKISGANLHRNWVMIPHVTNTDDADITDLEAFRIATNKENEKTGAKVTMLAFLIKASVAALRKFPEFNASIDGEELVLKKYFNIAFAADTPNGLVVPVIKDADKKGILDISKETAELAKKGREGKLSPAEMSGACFTISSLGGIGGRYFTPIINAPEVAILGVCRNHTEPVWDGKQFQPRVMLPLSLSYDHRVIDGALAARFNTYLCRTLADFRRIML